MVPILDCQLQYRRESGTNHTSEETLIQPALEEGLMIEQCSGILFLLRSLTTSDPGCPASPRPSLIFRHNAVRSNRLVHSAFDGLHCASHPSTGWRQVILVWTAILYRVSLSVLIPCCVYAYHVCSDAHTFGCSLVMVSSLYSAVSAFSHGQRVGRGIPLQLAQPSLLAKHWGQIAE